MPPAARVGDATAHGSPLGPGPGSANVLIGGIPAWRAGSDLHACPLPSETPVVPHGTGNVAIGSKTVFINGMPAARMGDMIMEAVSPAPNSIIMGYPTVIIG